MPSLSLSVARRALLLSPPAWRLAGSAAESREGARALSETCHPTAEWDPAASLRRASSLRQASTAAASPQESPCALSARQGSAQGAAGRHPARRRQPRNFWLTYLKIMLA